MVNLQVDHLNIACVFKGMLSSAFCFLHHHATFFILWSTHLPQDIFFSHSDIFIIYFLYCKGNKTILVFIVQIRMDHGKQGKVM